MIKKMANYLIEPFQKYTDSQQEMKRYSISLIIWEIQIKTMRYRLIPVRLEWLSSKVKGKC